MREKCSICLSVWLISLKAMFRTSSIFAASNRIISWFFFFLFWLDNFLLCMYIIFSSSVFLTNPMVDADSKGLLQETLDAAMLPKLQCFNNSGMKSAIIFWRILR